MTIYFINFHHFEDTETQKLATRLCCQLRNPRGVFLLQLLLDHFGKGSMVLALSTRVGLLLESIIRHNVVDTYFINFTVITKLTLISLR